MKYLQDQKTYKRVYFRIEAGYQWGSGLSQEKHDQFRAEMREFLTANNFEIIEPEYKTSCIEGKRGAETLYCHPQSLSGYIDQTEIEKLESDLKSEKYKSFNCYKVDTYEEAINYTPDELQAELKTYKPEITKDIIQSFKISNLKFKIH